jgi:ABC-type microcin C transport system permease subunit YejB
VFEGLALPGIYSVTTRFAAARVVFLSDFVEETMKQYVTSFTLSECEQKITLYRSEDMLSLIATGRPVSKTMFKGLALPVIYSATTRFAALLVVFLSNFVERTMKDIIHRLL